MLVEQHNGFWHVVMNEARETTAESPLGAPGDRANESPHGHPKPCLSKSAEAGQTSHSLPEPRSCSIQISSPCRFITPTPGKTFETRTLPILPHKDRQFTTWGKRRAHKSGQKQGHTILLPPPRFKHVHQGLKQKHTLVRRPPSENPSSCLGLMMDSNNYRQS